jgi:hypothetical protein
MLVTGCLIKWLQGESSSTPPEHCKPIAKLDTKPASPADLQLANILQKGTLISCTGVSPSVVPPS